MKSYKNFHNINDKIYKHIPSANMYKYICDANDFGDLWNAWADVARAEKATVEDMLSI